VAQPLDVPISKELSQAAASALIPPSALAAESAHGTAHEQQCPEQQELEAASGGEGEATLSAPEAGLKEVEVPGDSLSRVLVRGNTSLLMVRGKESPKRSQRHF
jgi:hypothetical protein